MVSGLPVAGSDSERAGTRFCNRIKIIKIDIDKNSSVAMKYGVGNLPTLMLFKDGKLCWRKDGVIPRTGLIEVIFENS